MKFTAGNLLFNMVQIAVFISISSAKYIAQNTQTRDNQIRTQSRRLFTRTQTSAFPQNFDYLTANRFNKQTIEQRQAARNKMTSSARNSLAENSNSGVNIQIGNHHIRHTSNGIHVNIGRNSRRTSIKYKPRTTSGLTRIILMRNRNRAARRNIVVKTSRGAQVHISRNSGRGNGLHYVINTGKRAPTRRMVDNPIPVQNNGIDTLDLQKIASGLQNIISSNTASGLQNDASASLSQNSPFGLQNTANAFQNSNYGPQNSGMGIDNSILGLQNVLSNLINNAAGPQTRGDNSVFDTTTQSLLSTTEPEDIDLFP